MQLFHTSRPSGFVSINILGPLTEKSQGKRFTVLGTEYYNKLTRAISSPNIKALVVAPVFLEEQIVLNEISNTILPDNGPPFVSKDLAALCVYVYTKFVTAI